jgi:hypothetical protein
MLLGRRTFKLMEKGERDWLLAIHPSMTGMDLTGMTVEDLDAFQAFINEACDEAREAAANGDVTLFRLYSIKPQTLRFPRPDKKEKQDEHPDPDDAEHRPIPPAPDGPRPE